MELAEAALDALVAPDCEQPLSPTCSRNPSDSGDGLMSASDFSEMPVFRDVWNSVIIEK